MSFEKLPWWVGPRLWGKYENWVVKRVSVPKYALKSRPFPLPLRSPAFSGSRGAVRSRYTSVTGPKLYSRPAARFEALDDRFG